MDRVRTQVYLEPEQHRWLRDEAKELDVPMTELLRQIIDEHVRERRRVPSASAFMRIVGLGESNVDDVSERHDDYLAEEIARGHIH